MAVTFEGMERRMPKIEKCLAEYGIANLEEARKICNDLGFDPYDIVKGVQPIAFENAGWAYTLGCAVAVKKGAKTASEAAEAIGIGLEAFCIPGSVAEQRNVGRGHGNLGAMLLRDETKCFAFLAGHESFAAAEGAIGIAEKANKVRKKPLRVILNGLGKDAAQIISRINGFTYVETEYDPYKNEVKEVFRKAYSEGLRAKVNCYGANSVPEGVAIMWKEDVDVSITGNSTNPTRFQHPVAGTYKKERLEAGKKYFSVASGGGTGRTLHPDNMAAGPASYGMTDTLGRMHSDAQFAGSSSVPAHVEMMGLIGAGNTPMDGRKIKKRKRIQMNLKKKYGNYELHPQMKSTGYENEIWDEKKEIIEELKRAVQEKQKEKKTCILSFDLYPGVRKEEMMELANALQPDRIFDIEDCAKDEETLLREFKDYITDDRVFGIMCHKTIDTWFESEKLETVKKAIETERAEEKDTNGGLIVIVGTAAELLTEADLLVYCDLTRWEVQLRYRSGMPNWHSTNYNLSLIHI